MLAEHYLDSDAIVRVCALAWLDTVESPQPEAFLRTAVERSKNVNVRAICCLSLGRHQQDLARLVRDINDPVRGQIVAKNLERLGPEVALIQRLRALILRDSNARRRSSWSRTHQGLRRPPADGRGFRAARRAGRR